MGNLPTSQYNQLLEVIHSELLRKGIKATTMDSLAASLQMSKRTLYEIFHNKENMVNEALKFWHQRLSTVYRKIFEQSENIMEAMVKCLDYTREWINMANVNFLRDVDEFYRNYKCDSNGHNTQHAELIQVFQKGAEQGYFRKDLNFLLYCRILTIQMESLKRMEESFPSDISLLEAFDAITTGFLRSISTPLGMEYLNSHYPEEPIVKEKL